MRTHSSVKRPEANVSQQEIATPTTCNSLTKKRPLTPTQKLTYTATMIALALALKIVGQLIGGWFQLFGLKISLIYIAWIISAVALGPLEAITVAFASDALGTFMLPTTGGIIPLNVVSNTLFPLFIWLAVKFIPCKNLFLKITIGTVISAIVCTMGIGSLGLWLQYYQAMPYHIYLFAVRAPQLIILGINLVIVGLLLPALKKLKLIPRKE